MADEYGANMAEITPAEIGSCIPNEQELRRQFEIWLPEYWSRETHVVEDGDVLYVEDWVQGAWVMFRSSQAHPRAAPAHAADPRLHKAVEEFIFAYRAKYKTARGAIRRDAPLLSDVTRLNAALMGVPIFTAASIEALQPTQGAKGGA